MVAAPAVTASRRPGAYEIVDSRDQIDAGVGQLAGSAGGWPYSFEDEIPEQTRSSRRLKMARSGKWRLPDLDRRIGFGPDLVIKTQSPFPNGGPTL